MLRTALSPNAPLVEANWLSEHLNDAIVLDCSVERIEGAQGETFFAPGHALFERGHIPNARFADVLGAFSDPRAPYPFTCPTRTGIENAAREIGIDNDSIVVAYDTLGGAYAARLWCVFTAFGFSNVLVLNGG
ncbi:MAG TPA: rhodanese-like domain-containing protein, partial [Rhizobium sp.]